MPESILLPPPRGLRAGGKALWADVAALHDLDVAQVRMLEAACRAKDRADAVDAAFWANRDDPVALKKANETANLLKQLLAALRLPDAATGKVPQYRGPRGAQRPSVPAGVSSLERARAAKAGA